MNIKLKENKNMSSKDDRKNNLKKIAYAGVLAALVFVGTELHIPTAIGHINLGDFIILVSSYILGPFAFVPAAIGSTLADLLAGYPQYAVATFLIKGIMGLVAGILLKRNREGKTSFIRKFSASLIAELIMIAGYFAFESLPFMYGVEAALGSVIPNGIQASAAIVGAVPLMYVKFFDKYQLSKSSEVHKRNEKTAVS
ncbi:MAG: ECF transporter S component [Ruminococcaceae bacterium]|nr:ECF transporter S component [Oscillospiraceae bacterium]